MALRKVGKGMLVILCVVILLLLGFHIFVANSPLYQRIGVDNSIFLCVGRGIAEGKIPYVELNENKGPLFFLLMGIPQMLIEGTVGVFVLEELMMLGMCLMIALCARWLMEGKPWALCAVVGIVVYLLMSRGGNFCEEYDLFFLWLGITAMIHTYTYQTTHQKWRAVCLGIATAGIALIKLSDILGLGMAVLCYFTWVIRNKRQFWQEVLRYLGGVVMISLPVFAYLSCVDAIGPMFENYIINNFVHVAKGENVNFIDSRLYLLRLDWYGGEALKRVAIMIAAVAVCLLFQKMKKNSPCGFSKSLYVFAVLLAVGNFLVSFVASSGFIQHLDISIGTCILAVMLICSALLKTTAKVPFFSATQALLAAVLACSVTFSMLKQVNPDNWVKADAYQQYVEYQQELLPELEGYEDSVYSIGVWPEWYWHNKLYPAYPYFNVIGFICDNVGVGQAEAFEEWMTQGNLQALVIEGNIEDYRDILTHETIDYITENYYFYTSDSKDVRQLWLII